MNKDTIANFFQGAADLIDRAGEPIFSFIAVFVPFVAPFVTAQITATALVIGGILNQSQANQIAAVLEGIGVVGLSGLVLAIDKWIRSKNEKLDTLIYLLGGVDIIYFLFLIAVNVLLDLNNPKVTGVQIAVKVLICLVPLMAGAIYGYYRVVNKDKIAKVEADNKAYQIRQEQREDKLKGKMIKAGINPFAQQFAMDTPQVKEQKEKHASDYKDKAVQFIVEYHQKNRKLPTPKNLTERFNLIHSKNKGYMSKLISDTAKERRLQ